MATVLVLWEQVCDELQHHHKQQLERRVQQAAHQARHQWRRWHNAPALQRTRGVHALNCTRIFVPQLDDDTAHLMAQVLSAFHIFIHGHQHGALSLTRPLHFLLLPLPPVCHRLPLPPRAVPWAPLHDRHGKPALLRCRREWGHPERLHLSHIETILVITILLTSCQYRSRRERIFTIFVGSCPVSTVFSSRMVYTERTK